MRPLLTSLLFISLTAQATPPAIHVTEVERPADKVYTGVYHALEARKLWVVFEANVGEGLKGFAEKWGEDYNRNRFTTIRSLVVCNPWYANQVANADPDMLALCPLHLTITEREGKTRVLFLRPTAIAADSPARATLEEVERLLVEAVAEGTSGHQGASEKASP